MSLFLRFNSRFGRCGESVLLVGRYRAINLQSKMCDSGGELLPANFVYVVQNSGGKELAMDRSQLIMGKQTDHLYVVNLESIPETQYYDFYFASEQKGPIYSSCPDGVPARCLVTGEELVIPLVSIARWKPRDRCDSSDGRWVKVESCKKFDTPIPRYLRKSTTSERFRELH